MSQTQFRPATVLAIENESDKHQEALVQLEQSAPTCAINYVDLCGHLQVGDRVIVNTTALTLQLGTGGYHYVLSRINSPDTNLTTSGHAIKLRYTPMQLCCQLVEERMADYQGPWHVEGMPVAVAELHSQIPLILAGIRAHLPTARLAYILTEGGALPAAFSQLVRQMKAAGLVDIVISAGQAFGGDWEAVNVPSALVAARVLGRCHAAVIGMGPGQLGTGTKLGFSGIEQADNLNRVAALKGIPVAALRLSQQDERSRHQGISHHTLTVLGQLTLRRCLYAFPKELAADPFWITQRAQLGNSHWAVEVAGSPAVEYLRQCGLNVRNMGRLYDSDPAFFLASGAAGGLVARLLQWRVRLARKSHRGSRGQSLRKARTVPTVPLK